MAKVDGAGDPHAVVEKEILNELRQIRALLERQRQAGSANAVAAQTEAETAKVSTVGFEMGRKDAPVTIVEFADYQCPYCKQFNSTVFAQLKKEYIDVGKVRFVSRDLPLDFHPNAFGAAEAARCAGEQNKFWQMWDMLISHSDTLAPDALSAYADELGLDKEKFHACVVAQTYAANIRADASEANAQGLTGTPSFVIGPVDGNSVTGEKIVGAMPFENFEKILAKYAN